MTNDRRAQGEKPRPANDNRQPDGTDAGRENDLPERLDKLVLTIARMIGRQIAREHFEALQAANDNQKSGRPASMDEDHSGEEGQ